MLIPFSMWNGPEGTRTVETEAQTERSPRHIQHKAALTALFLLTISSSGHCGRCQQKDDAISLLTAQAHGFRQEEDALSALSNAVFSCETADHELFMGLGAELYQRGDIRSALAAFRSALRLVPGSMDHANNVAACLIDAGLAREAVAVLASAERRNGGMAGSSWKTHINMAGALAEIEQLTRSAARWEAALTTGADFPHRPAAVANLIYINRQLLRWSRWDAEEEAVTTLCRYQVNGSFDGLAPGLPVDPYMALSLTVDPHLMLQVAAHAASLLPRPPVRFTETPTFRPPISAGGRISLGYAGSEFGRGHSINLLMRGVFSGHDRRRFAVHCIALHGDGRTTSAVEESCEHWVGVGSDGDREAAERVNALGLHILVDLNGWTAGHRMPVLAARPAALLVAYMGFPGSTGAGFVDYAVWDRHTAPPEHASLFSEKLMLMPGSYWVTDYLRAGLSRGGRNALSRAEYGLREGAVVLCNHDKVHKYDPSRLRTWLGVLGKLRRVDRGRGGEEHAGGGAQLWLLSSGAHGDANLRSHTPSDLREGLVLGGKVGVSEHLTRLRLCDVALDTRAINGHTTASNYLWAQVPVVTVPLQHVAGRVAGGMLVAIAQSCPAVAVGLARNEAELEKIALALGEGAHVLHHAHGGSDSSVSQLEEDASARRGNQRAAVLRKAQECLALEVELARARAACGDAGQTEADSDLETRWRGLCNQAAGHGGGFFDTGAWVGQWETLLRLSLEASRLEVSVVTPMSPRSQRPLDKL